MTSGSLISVTASSGRNRPRPGAKRGLSPVNGAERRPVGQKCIGAALLMTLLPGAVQAQTSPVGELLHRTGRVVETFWKQISGVTCSETISQSKLDLKGKTIYQQEGAFDYLVLLRLEGQEVSIEESRMQQREARNKKKVPLLVTNGFSTLVLIFHPYYQSSFEYSLLTDEVLNGKRLRRVGFRPVRGARSPTALMAGGREYPLPLEGKAWIDPETEAIVRIAARLDGPLDDLGLRQMESDVRYAPVAFEGGTEAYWLPVTASIEAESAQQRWRNVHRFSRYRKFTVNSRIVPNP